MVEFRLHPTDGGTTVTVSHRGLPEPEATDHQRGWQHFLRQLAAIATAG
jgi:uncharacterized protein YndB with AHSA1/START domain